jgi:hypothetical protein
MTDNPTPVTDTPIDTSTPIEFVSLEELSTLSTTKMPLPKYGNKFVEFMSYIPLEDMAELQAKYLGNKKDYLGYSMAVLKIVMVNPPIKTPESFNALRRADSGVLLEIVGRVVSSQQAQEISENLGNA